MKFNLAFFDKLSAPFINRQESIDLYVLKKIAERIKDIGKLSPEDLNTLEQYAKSSEDIALIKRELSKLCEQQRREIKSIVTESAEASYIQSKPAFEYRNIEFIPSIYNFDIQDLITAYVVALQTLYKGFENGVGFKTTDKGSRNNKSIVPVSEAYTDIVNNAIRVRKSKTLDYNLAIRPQLEQLIDSRLKVDVSDTDTPFVRTFYNVSNNLVLNGIRDVVVAVQNKVAKLFGADGKEIVAHIHSAPDHEPSQGHQFTDEEFEKIQNAQDFEDIQGRKYQGFPRAIGTWNCRHIVLSIICGVTKPQNTDEELEQLKIDNAKGYTFPNGKHLTMYECTQQQRKMEREIRINKENYIIAKAAGDTELADRYQSKVGIETNKYLTFSKNCGLKPQRGRIKVSGYH